MEEVVAELRPKGARPETGRGQESSKVKELRGH